MIGFLNFNLSMSNPRSKLGSILGKFLKKSCLLLRQLNMSILCGISNLWMLEVTTNMCRPLDESPHK